MTRDELWKENIKYYRELIDKHKFELEPVIDLINMLDNVGFGKLFYLSNSHESLVLSMFDTSKKRFENSWIKITYSSLTKNYNLQYRNKQAIIIDSYSCESHLIQNEFKRINDWLTITNYKS